MPEFFFILRKHKIGEIRLSPYDVYLDGKNAYQPDIIFIANKHLNRIKHNGLYGAPDLVIEILSPSTMQYDKNAKNNVYARCGVMEYWMINPADDVVIGYQLVSSEYQEMYTGKGVLESKMLGCRLEF